MTNSEEQTQLDQGSQANTSESRDQTQATLAPGADRTAEVTRATETEEAPILETDESVPTISVLNANEAARPNPSSEDSPISKETQVTKTMETNLTSGTVLSLEIRRTIEVNSCPETASTTELNSNKVVTLDTNNINIADDKMMDLEKPTTSDNSSRDDDALVIASDQETIIDSDQETVINDQDTTETQRDNLTCGARCGKQAHRLMLACSICTSWFHFECEHFDKRLMYRYVTYVCLRCEKQKKGLTEWVVRKRLSASERQDKERNCYAVEAILDIRGSDSDEERKFLIKWRGYRATTWEPERNLFGCVPMLNTFLRHLNPPRRLTRITGLLGKSTNIEPEIRNWQSIDKVINSINQFRSMSSYRCSLEVRVWDSEFGTNDCLYLYPYKEHCYILLYYAAKQVVHLADGSNQFIYDLATRKQISKNLPILINPVKYNQQYRADHCASSAVLITLSFLKSYKYNKEPTAITSSISIRNRVARQLHKYQSLVTTSREESLAIARSLKIRKCVNCGKQFTGKRASQGLAVHNSKHCPLKQKLPITHL